VADCLVAPSHGEGFGLPIAEAEQFGLPVLARDIPVFHEIAPQGTSFFTGTDGASLAKAITTWLAGTPKSPPKARPVPGTAQSSLPQNWTDSTRQLLANIIDGKWHRTLPASQSYAIKPADKRLGSHVGRRDDGRLIANGKGGTLVFGPWLEFAAGKYEVTFRLKVLKVSKGGADFKIYAQGGQVDLAYKRIDGLCSVATDERRVTLPMILSKALSDVEVNLTIDDDVIVELLSIEVQRFGDAS
jgi:hypothetical protein